MPDDSAVDGNLTEIEFRLEEYKQVVAERRFVMTRYMQALGLYLMLAGFAARELAGARSRFLATLLLAVFTIFNALAIYVAGRFRSMAYRAMRREMILAAEHKLEPMHELFWGYSAGLIVVILDQIAVLAIYVWVLRFG